MFPRLAEVSFYISLLFSLTIFTGCPLSAGLSFVGFVENDQEHQQRGRKTSKALMVKLRNPDSGEATWCQEDWAIWFWLGWTGDEVQMC